MTLAKCANCKRWEFLDKNRLCEVCRIADPEPVPVNDGNALFDDEHLGDQMGLEL